MDAMFSLPGVAILGYWIPAVPAGMTKFEID